MADRARAQRRPHRSARRAQIAQFRRSYDRFDGHVSQERLRNRHQHAAASDGWLGISADGISVGAELGVLSPDGKSRAWAGICHTAFRSAAPSGHRAELDVGNTALSLAAREIEDQLESAGVL